MSSEASLQSVFSSHPSVQKIKALTADTETVNSLSVKDTEISSPYGVPGLKFILQESCFVSLLVSSYFAMVLTNWATIQVIIFIYYILGLLLFTLTLARTLVPLFPCLVIKISIVRTYRPNHPRYPTLPYFLLSLSLCLSFCLTYFLSLSLCHTLSVSASVSIIFSLCVSHSLYLFPLYSRYFIYFKYLIVKS